MIFDAIKLLPEWMRGDDPIKLVQGAWAFWSDTERAIRKIREQADIARCTLAMLNLHAWARTVKRYPGEPPELYRLRVQYARKSNQETGMINRLVELLEIYGARHIRIEEGRGSAAGAIKIVLDPSSESIDPNILFALIADTGRTCRKYWTGYSLSTETYDRAGCFTDAEYASRVYGGIDRKGHTFSVASNCQVGSCCHVHILTAS